MNPPIISKELFDSLRWEGSNYIIYPLSLVVVQESPSDLHHIWGITLGRSDSNKQYNQSFIVRSHENNLKDNVHEMFVRPWIQMINAEMKVKEEEHLTTDDWAESYPELAENIKTHIKVMADTLSPEEQYSLFRLIMISVRQEFQDR